MKKIFLFSFFSLNVFGCEISPQETYLKLGKTFFPSIENTIIKDCKENDLVDFTDRLSSLEGVIPTSYLAEDMPSKGIIFKNENIKIINLQKHLNQTALDFSFQNTSFNNSSKVANNFDLVRVECNSCDQPGKKTFKIILKDNEKQKEIWVSSTFQKKITYLKAKDNIFDIDSPLSESNFQKTEIYTADPQIYFADFDKVKFYRAATKITKDMALKNELLVKNYLVRQGNTVEVILKNDLLSITNRGQAMANGKYGESIRVRTANKKELSGIIKDFNQVEVQL